MSELASSWKLRRRFCYKGFKMGSRNYRIIDECNNTRTFVTANNGTMLLASSCQRDLSCGRLSLPLLCELKLMLPLSLFFRVTLYRERGRTFLSKDPWQHLTNRMIARDTFCEYLSMNSDLKRHARRLSGLSIPQHEKRRVQFFSSLSSCHSRPLSRRKPSGLSK